MAHDFEVEPGLTFGDWLRAEISEATIIESNGFFVDQAADVAGRLQAGRPPDDRLEVLIPWLWFATAFTAPGHYIYLSRRLVERCRNEESVAFVVAHEIAHHDLGHLGYFRSGLAQRFAKLGPAKVAILFFRAIQRRLYSLGNECDADRYALKLCIEAGYDPWQCVRFFDMFRQYLLDLGDIDGVYGLDEDSDEELSPSADFMTKARIWLWLRRRGYLPLQDRQAELERALRRWEDEGVPLHDSA